MWLKCRYCDFKSESLVITKNDREEIVELIQILKGIIDHSRKKHEQAHEEVAQTIVEMMNAVGFLCGMELVELPDLNIREEKDLSRRELKLLDVMERVKDDVCEKLDLADIEEDSEGDKEDNEDEDEDEDDSDDSESDNGIVPKLLEKLEKKGVLL